MRRTGHRSQGKAVEKTALPPFEPPGRYLEQRKEALNHGDGAAYPNRTDDLLFTRQLLYQLS